MSDCVDTTSLSLGGSAALTTTEPRHGAITVPFGEGTSKGQGGTSDDVVIIDISDEEEEVLSGPKSVCRVCQDEDYIMRMEDPCACKGSIKYSHRNCIQKWCLAKKNILCEICHAPFEPDYDIALKLQNRGSGTLVLDANDGGMLAPGAPRLMHAPPLLIQDEVEEPDYESEPEPEPEPEENPRDRGRTLRWYTTLALVMRAVQVQAILCGCNALFLTVLLFKDIFFAPKGRQSSETALVYYLLICLLIPSYLSSFILNYWETHYGPKIRRLARANANTENRDGVGVGEVVITIDSGEQNGAMDRRLEQVHESGQEITTEPAGDHNHTA